ncbi:hypothetical protein SLS53_007190 [Cytospora paraplurivora]|uniref:Uncharacterized protein n=1 Tax=Cytospora paraplurivora TaxID=2898453 RepID=A0AAN9U429_9PEZI
MASTNLRPRLATIKEKVRLHGDDNRHEQTDAWSNRDLIPLPPERRTWNWFLYFGYWTISSLNISNWQSPNTFLTEGLSVAQSMVIIVIGRLLISLFSILIAWCGLTWHIGFTIQNRFSWGLRASYIPLVQRILLNFIWNAVQCWNGGRLVAVCLTAIWPRFATMPEFLPAGMAAVTTGYQFIGFIVFWVVSAPFLWIKPESFKWPFRVTSIYCGIGMLCMMIWALATAKGVGSLMTQGQNVPKGWKNASWLMMAGINQMIGGIAAGITNGSDFSRYAKGPKHYISGTLLSAWVAGILVSVVGLITTSAAQKIYGEVYWNPPDLLMVMMDSGNGSSRARAGVFFLSFGFALTACFENICGNAVAGGIDLSGLFPRYINIRRGAIITFVAAWICQPWQLINKAATFISVMNSFSVFLSPIIGIMATDFLLLRRRKIRLTHLYRFFVSAIIFFALNKLFPVTGMGEYDEVDHYGTFTIEECAKWGVTPSEQTQISFEDGSSASQIQETFDKKD